MVTSMKSTHGCIPFQHSVVIWYISHDNIDEINTWKCPIQAVVRLYRYSSFMLINYTIGGVDMGEYPDDAVMCTAMGCTYLPLIAIRLNDHTMIEVLMVSLHRDSLRATRFVVYLRARLIYQRSCFSVVRLAKVKAGKAYTGTRHIIMCVNLGRSIARMA